MQSGQKEDKNTPAESLAINPFIEPFNLPKDVVDIDKFEAKYENRLLQLLIPKKEEAKQKPPRLIQIS